MRESAHETSPAVGGVIIAVVMMLSLAYAFGYGNQVVDLADHALSGLLFAIGQGVTHAASAVQAWSQPT